MDCGCSERISVPLRKDLFLLFSCSYSLWLHRLQHARLPCPSLSPGVCSDSCPLSGRRCPTISSSIPFSFCLQSFPASQSFQSLDSASSGQSVGASASESVPPMCIQGRFPLGLSGLISLLSRGILRVFVSNTVWKYQFFSVQFSLWSNSHIHTWLLEKP